MESNADIRQRMNTYRDILLGINWIASILGALVGLGWSERSRYAFFITILAILLGVIGHFLINVGLAIPFILLNNGDILNSMKRDMENDT